jgi:hypothetical protein
MHYLNETVRYSGSAENNNSGPSMVSRRGFLKRVVFIGAAGLIVPGLLSACSNEGSVERTEPDPSGNAMEQGAEVTTACPATAELSAQDKATRQSLNYVDESPEPEKFCANCRFFKQPAATAACGGCEIVGGPIAAKGYCNTWVA